MSYKTEIHIDGNSTNLAYDAAAYLCEKTSNKSIIANDKEIKQLYKVILTITNT